ncbi:hypothetical protein Tco_0964478, partial [Tanacetum coccineum]
MPEETYSTALSAASFLRSSCVKGWTGVGAEKALMVRWRVGMRVGESVVVAVWWRKVESGGRVRKDREAMMVVVRAVVRLPDPKRKTLGEKGIDCIFVGYAEHSKAYRPKDIIPNFVESQRDDHSDDVPSEIPKPRKGKRVWKAKSYGFFSDFSSILSLMGSRDDIGIQYSYMLLSRFTSNPSRQHWKAITRVFKYLRDSSSTSGWVFRGGAISLAFKKQTCITSSTMESEFVALVAAGKKAEWLRNLIYEILIWQKPIAPISIRCDSAPTMDRAYSQIYNGKSRHL